MSDIVFDGMIFDRLREIGDQSDRIASLESEIARLRITGIGLEVMSAAAAYLEKQQDFQMKAWAETLRGIARKHRGAK